MNEVSSRIPKPLMVATVKFSHPLLTTGSPNQVYRRQFRSAMMYGMHENSSVLPFLVTLVKVNLKKKGEKVWYILKNRIIHMNAGTWDVANWVHRCCVKEQGSRISCKRSKGKLLDLAVFVSFISDGDDPSGNKKIKKEKLPNIPTGKRKLSPINIWSQKDRVCEYWWGR